MLERFLGHGERPPEPPSEPSPEPPAAKPQPSETARRAHAEIGALIEQGLRDLGHQESTPDSVDAGRSRDWVGELTESEPASQVEADLLLEDEAVEEGRGSSEEEAHQETLKRAKATIEHLRRKQQSSGTESETITPFQEDFADPVGLEKLTREQVSQLVKLIQARGRENYRRVLRAAHRAGIWRVGLAGNPEIRQAVREAALADLREARVYDLSYLMAAVKGSFRSMPEDDVWREAAVSCVRQLIDQRRWGELQELDEFSSFKRWAAATDQQIAHDLARREQRGRRLLDDILRGGRRQMAAILGLRKKVGKVLDASAANETAGNQPDEVGGDEETEVTDRTPDEKS